jgi:hypothetical protein
MSNQRQSLAFWLLAVGALVALPIAIFATCSVRGDYVPEPLEKPGIVPKLAHDLESITIGAVVGIALVIFLAWTAVNHHRSGKMEKQPEGDNLSGP